MTEAAPKPVLPAAPRLGKPRLRGVSHQWAFFVSCAIGAALVVAAPSGTPRLAATIYAVSVAALFGVSALYHRTTWASAAARRWMRRLDHSAIFVLIAGTYTPFALLVLDGPIATVILVVVWAGALGGDFTDAKKAELSERTAALAERYPLYPQLSEPAVA